MTLRTPAKIRPVLTAALLALSLPTLAAADERELVELPAPMQEHMLGNMRDHLHALNDILTALAAGDVREAGKVAEQRLGLSSLDDHGAAHMAPFMPQGMRDTGTELHKAASRFAQTAADAEVEGTYEAQQRVFGALQGITDVCNACHDGYRIR